ncbi:MAG: UDP-N-acetylmuramoyl-L-alanyl-D-glutamate--2,6-diaminopimelate ligase [bacterium]|nr:UDP-N-acetylmuramoyl-L-alanyl-D-glutamate--2,6-diaminopimelate ligase [bacterium]
MIKRLLRAIVPKRVVNTYHVLEARVAALRAGLPARKLLVIGVTGTKGKSTTVAMLAHCLTALGERVAFSSTVQWGMLGKTWPNRSKLTMPGRGELQHFLARAVKAGCTVTVLEVSSEGLAQGRHLGIAFDAAVFLNLTPEHVESHGSFRMYREAKERLFSSLNRPWRKTLNGKKIPTVIAANVDDSYAFSFLRHAADVHVGFTQTDSSVKAVPGLAILRAEQVACTSAQCTFQVAGAQWVVPLLGAFNVQNALATLAVLDGLGYDRSRAAVALANFPGVPGRMEEVALNAPFRVFVDYSHEPASLQAAYAAVRLLEPKRLLTLLGAQGGGRDHAKRSVMGALAAEHADVVVVTNEDPYDEDPEKIIADVATAAEAIGKANISRITDRRAAIAKLLQLGQAGDVLLLTGKGGEEVMAVANGKLIPWDDRVVLKEVWATMQR